MNLTADEINFLAAALAGILSKGCSKKEIIKLKCFLSQVICSLGTFLID